VIERAGAAAVVGDEVPFGVQAEIAETGGGNLSELLGGESGGRTEVERGTGNKADEVERPAQVPVPPALLSAKTKAAPVPRLMTALPVTSRVPTVSVRVSASKVAVPMETAEPLGSTSLAPSFRVPSVMVVVLRCGQADVATDVEGTTDEETGIVVGSGHAQVDFTGGDSEGSGRVAWGVASGDQVALLHGCAAM
jgi:hypothetical protein